MMMPHHSRIVLREIAAVGANIDAEVLRYAMPILELASSILAAGVDEGRLRATDPAPTRNYLD